MIIDRIARAGIVLVALGSLAACSDDPVGPGPDDSLVTLVKTLSVPANYGIHDQFVRDGYAFLCIWDNGLHIYDVGNGSHGGTPANPVFVGGLVTNANGVSGGPAAHNAWWYHDPGGLNRYVFVGQEGPAVGGIGSGSSGDIHVVDISDMENPVEVAFFHLDGLGAPLDSAGTHNFWVDETNEILYAAYYNGGVVALDISGDLSGDLAAREIDRIQPGGPGNTYTWGVQRVGSSLFAIDMLSGLWRLTLNGSTLEVVNGGNNVTDRFSSDLWVSNDVAYTATWGGFERNGNPGDVVKVWNVGSGAPVLADTLMPGAVQTLSDVEVSADGNLLVVTAEGGAGGAYFYDVSAGHRLDPVFLGYFPVTNGLHTGTLADIGGRRYLFGSRNPPGPALIVLDVTGISP